jgi:DNA-3-methyladenine glycosylase II
MQTFHVGNFTSLCDELGRKDKALKSILRTYGYPPMWTRPGSFPTLIHIILEQQVSLASAKAAFVKLKERLGTITPKSLLLLSDDELRACYFSRQKSGYARHLAEMIIAKKLVLKNFPSMADDEVRKQLKEVKGIGEWTADIYLLFALQRTDIFPLGDLAMVNALREIKEVPLHTKDELLLLAEKWRPNRSIATMLLWHHYLQKRGIRI